MKYFDVIHKIMLICTVRN